MPQGTKQEKNLVKPLYDRYQMIKRLLCASPTITTIVRNAHRHTLSLSTVPSRLTDNWQSPAGVQTVRRPNVGPHFHVPLSFHHPHSEVRVCSLDFCCPGFCLSPASQGALQTGRRAEKTCSFCVISSLSHRDLVDHLACLMDSNLIFVFWGQRRINPAVSSGSVLSFNLNVIETHEM